MKRTTAENRVIKNYKYAVYPTEPVPEALWEQARAMNALWNELVACRDRLIADLKSLRETAAAGTANDLTSEATRPSSPPRNQADPALWRDFDRQLVAIIRRADWKARLGDNARDYVLGIFRVASVTAFRTKGMLRPKSPNLSNIVIPYRFTEGGWPTDRIYHQFSKKIHFDRLPPEVFERRDWQSRRARFTRGFYGYGSDNRPLPLRILLHRPLPTNGLIKTTQLIGTLDRLKRIWRWHLLIACQTEAVETVKKAFQPSAALDLGYRRMDDYLRVGYVIDTDGNEYELRLPIIEPPSRKLLNALKSVNRGRERQQLSLWSMSEFYPVTIFDVAAWQGRNDARVERVKEQLAEMLSAEGAVIEQSGDRSEEVQAFLSRLKVVRRTGLLEFRRLLAEANAEDLLGVQKMLDEWSRRDTETLIKIKTTNTHLINKRNKIYENIALWLRSNFSHLIVRKNLHLQQTVELSSKIGFSAETVALKNSVKYRFFAALSVFQQKIGERNSDQWLIESEVPRAGTTCFRCRADGEATAALKVVCPNGHEADQDAQACRNRLRELSEETITGRRRLTPLIPGHLKKYIVIIEEGK